MMDGGWLSLCRVKQEPALMIQGQAGECQFSMKPWNGKTTPSKSTWGGSVMAANSGAAAADDRLDLNTGKGWSEMDLFDLAITVRMKNSIEFIAIFLGRSRREVRDKIAELKQSGELGRLIERIEAFLAIDCGHL